MKITFLGGGNMANALIGGMFKQGFAAADITVIDPVSYTHLDVYKRQLFVHRFGGDLARSFKLDIAVIARRRSTHFVDHVHQHLRAVGRQPLPGNRVFGQHLLAGGDGRHEGFAIGDVTHPERAADGNGLEVFRAHHRTDAGTTGGAVQIVDDRREEHLVFAGTTDTRHAQQWILVALLERAFRSPDGPAPQVIRRQQPLSLIHI